MMHFMPPPDRPDIRIITPGKPFEPLVNDHIMYYKIREAISHDPEPHCLHPPGMVKSSKPDQQDTGHSKYDEKGIILFKKSGFCPVMVLVQVP
jgi:hypothetical protein